MTERSAEGQGNESCFTQTEVLFGRISNIYSILLISFSIGTMRYARRRVIQHRSDRFEHIPLWAKIFISLLIDLNEQSSIHESHKK